MTELSTDHIDEPRTAVSRAFSSALVIESLHTILEDRPEQLGTTNARLIAAHNIDDLLEPQARQSLEELISDEFIDAPVYPPFRRLGNFAVNQEVIYSHPKKGGSIERTVVAGHHESRIGKLILKYASDHQLIVPPTYVGLMPMSDYKLFESQSGVGTGHTSPYRTYFLVAGAAVEESSAERNAVARIYRDLGGDHTVMSNGRLERPYRSDKN